MVDFGKAISSRMRERKLTPKQLADQSKMTFSGLSAALNRGTPPSAKNLKNIAEALATTPKEITAEAEKLPDPSPPGSRLRFVSDSPATVHLDVPVPEELFDRLSARAAVDQATHAQIVIELISGLDDRAQEGADITDVLEAMRAARE